MNVLTAQRYIYGVLHQALPGVFHGPQFLHWYITLYLIWSHECVNMTLKSQNSITMKGESTSHYFPLPSPVPITRSCGYQPSKGHSGAYTQYLSYLLLPTSEVSTVLAFPFAKEKIVLGRDKGRIFSLNLGPELKGIKDF